LSEFTLSDRVQLIKPSPTLAVTTRARELRAQGRDVIGLGAGEPDFDTPQNIKDAAVDAIARGMTRYTAVDGTPELKQAVLDKFSRENGLDYDLSQILVSAGAKHSLYNMIMALIGEGDEVIIPAPYWVSYPDIVKLAGGKPVIVEADMASGFLITPDQLAAAISEKTKLFILNSPSNPTGAVYSRGQLEALGEVLREHPEVLIASDDIYEHVLWTDEPFTNIAMACPELKDQVMVINGVSKAYAMTGWRIGYAAGPANVIGAMRKIQGQSTSNAASISQAAALEALTGPQDFIPPMVEAFKARHDHVVDRLNRIDGVSCQPCAGTFYAFPDFSGAISGIDNMTNDLELSAWILDSAEGALVPGTAFGAPGFIRISYAIDLKTLDEAIDRIENLLKG